MIGPVVVGQPVLSPIYLLGQAPGDKEGPMGRPFSWTAGKTLFKWFEGLGVDEATFRSRVYMAAVCRCFPGKNPKGGDRVPTPQEIANCRPWIDAELTLLRPRLMLLVGKLAINQFLPVGKLSEVVGRLHPAVIDGVEMELLPLPHPSGASTWFKTEPGKTLLAQALALLERHPAWHEIRDGHD